MGYATICGPLDGITATTGKGGSDMAFNPMKHIMKVQGGRNYLPAAARIAWFRDTCKIEEGWGITTLPIEINIEKRYAIFHAEVTDPHGKVVGSGDKMEDVQGFPDYVEKAATGAISRALASCGFGTPDDADLFEGERYTDTPRGGDAPRQQTNRTANNNRPASPPPASRTTPAPAPATMREAGVQATADRAAGQVAVNAADGADEPVCSACGRALTQSQEMLSMRKYGFPLCPNCQKGHRAADADGQGALMDAPATSNAREAQYQ